MRNLQTLHLGTTARTRPELPMDLLFAVTWCAFFESCDVCSINLTFLLSCVQNNPTEKAGRETAFKASVEWLIKYL
jgi:hypothetical protein